MGLLGQINQKNSNVFGRIEKLNIGKYSTLILIAALFLQACAPSSKSETNSSQLDQNSTNGIVGGTVVDKSDNINSSIVALYNFEDGGSICTASLISQDVVVSAAHCIGTSASTLIAIFDLDVNKVLNSIKSIEDLKSNPSIRFVTKVFVPSAWKNHMTDLQNAFQTKTPYVDKNNHGDLSILKLSAPAPSTHKPARILSDSSQLTDGSEVTLAGYGITDGKSHDSGILRKVQVKVLKSKFTETEVTLDQRSGKGACHGDSGGPAYLSIKGERHLWGVTSRTYKDKDDTCKQISIYTNLTSFQTFIKSAMVEFAK